LVSIVSASGMAPISGNRCNGFSSVCGLASSLAKAAREVGGLRRGVYGRSEALRKKAAAAGLAYAAIIPCDYLVTTPAGTTTRSQEAIVSRWPGGCRA
jgi:hypothetical protein